jgi:F-type H+-transporting ATPase subunit epsilon
MKEGLTFTLTISQVDKQLYHEAATAVTLPGADGELTILPHHEPLITLLKPGIILVQHNSSQKQFVISKGLCEVHNNCVTILV